MPELLFFRDRELQMRSPLRQERIVLGRSPESDFTVPDRSVSRRQCELVQRGNGYTLIDLSGRGTPVSGRMASDRGTALRDGDEIRLGPFSIVYSALAALPERPEITESRQNGRVTLRYSTDGQVRAARNAWLRPHGRDSEAISLSAEDGFVLAVGSQPSTPQHCKLDDRFASADHFRITHRGGRWVLSDRSSANGTFVDGLQVGECTLHERATILAGETLLSFHQEAGPGRLSAEPLPGLVTRDSAMRPVVDWVLRLAPSQVPVAIHGETGVGKDVIASAIHQLSRRASGPFVALNCGAIARDTVESELFGHERGAFTGADRARVGAFEEAHGGTLFLDEIGDLPLSLQVKLLRVLERGEVRRLGANRSQTVDVRIVSATHRDLRAAVEEGTFREDLYYRLCVAPIEVPPLRQRISDIMPIAEYFAAKLQPGDNRITFVPAARARLENHPWYGNARELRNVVQLALLNRSGSAIMAEDLTFQPIPSRRPGNSTLQVAGKTLDQIERDAYRLALERNEGDRKAAMQELGVARSTFFRKLEEFGLNKPEAPIAVGGRSR